jgi:hypothetical protein
MMGFGALGEYALGQITGLGFWSEQDEESENWTEKTKQAETWVEVTRQAETWTET